jgi:acyl-coenzyme A thioesterase PaaI-like protein
MCYAPAVGERFLARAKVTKAGKRQVFAAAELFARSDGAERLVAGGSAVLMVA